MNEGLIRRIKRKWKVQVEKWWATRAKIGQSTEEKLKSGPPAIGEIGSYLHFGGSPGLSGTRAK